MTFHVIAYFENDNSSNFIHKEYQTEEEVNNWLNEFFDPEERNWFDEEFTGQKTKKLLIIEGKVLKFSPKEKVTKWEVETR